ncbi:hypothetical protein VHUM_00669 [Vanrija humicola]|uniref:Uncharacterized protein n=1 Tax=Vanrija humicola TaxID=5417 RepID=A0A7D8V2U1_VANHU|nr:hypothetical protein VHUM_00669 [Vanrija humicola]
MDRARVARAPRPRVPAGYRADPGSAHVPGRVCSSCCGRQCPPGRRDRVRGGRARVPRRCEPPAGARVAARPG